jgi:hypothetical protein
MIFATSNKNELKAKNTHSLVSNNNYILDATVGNAHGILRETRFVFDVEEDGFAYNDQLIECFRVGEVSVFHTFRHHKGQTL